MTLRVIPRIQDCWPHSRDNLPRLESDRVQWICVHQHGTKLADWPIVISSARDLARAHENHPALKRITGRLPYHFVLGESDLEQGVALSHKGCHAAGYNWNAVAVCILGTFRSGVAPSSEQWENLVELCTVLMGLYSLSVEAVVGHHRPDPRDEAGELLYLPGSSSDTKKKCPGPGFSIAQLRADLKSHPGQSIDPTALGIVT